MRPLYLLTLAAVLLAPAAIATGCGSTKAAAGPNDGGGEADALRPEEGGGGFDATGGDDAPIFLNPIGGALSDANQIGPIVDPLDGASGCDGGVAYDGITCSFAVAFRGGLTGVLEGNQQVQCGGHATDAGTSDINFINSDANPQLVDFTLTFSTPIVAGQIGLQPPAFANVTTIQFDGGAASSWTTASASCSVTLRSSACTLASSSLRYVMSGSASCPQPALPGAGTSAAPLTIGDFSFVTSVYPQ